MSNQVDWKVVSKPKKFKKPIPKKPVIDDDPIDIPLATDPNNGDDLDLVYTYVLWCHDVHNKDWSLQSYKKLCNISTVAEFWRLFNNFHKLGYRNNNFFLMKEGTDPIWEHPNNRYGGLCSFRTDIDSSLKMYEDLCIRMMCGMLTSNDNESEDINGVSICPKNNWCIIKIWNKDKNNDLSKILDTHILNTYKNASIKYKENEPEY
jgi:hypothetical protein